MDSTMRQHTWFGALVIVLFVAACSKEPKSDSDALKKADPASKSDAMSKSESEATQRLIDTTKRKLKDPESAQFRDVRFFAKSAVTPKGDRVDMGVHALCGQVNAKNSMGGYVGFVDFVAMEVEGASPPSVLMTRPAYDSEAERASLEGPFREASKEFCVDKTIQLK